MLKNLLKARRMKVWHTDNKDLLELTFTAVDYARASRFRRLKYLMQINRALSGEK